MLQVHGVGSCDERMFYVLSLQLLLTLWVVHVTINILPDDVLLLVFLFDRMISLEGFEGSKWGHPWRWQRLVHVCRRWRSVTFASPKFLDLKLTCLPNTRVELTHIWPPLPIVIKNRIMWSVPEDYDFNAAIVHPSRVCEINLCLTTDRAFQRLASAMQEPFPMLTQFGLQFDPADSPDSSPTLPKGFLVGSALHLRSLELDEVSIPGLPKLLLSATHLVTLHLRRTPYSAYISPEEMVTCISVLTSLESFAIGFKTDEESFFYLQSRCPPPSTRTVLPALTQLEFSGVSQYLEDLVARVVAPRLFHLSITFFAATFFDTPHLVQFTSLAPSLETPKRARVVFDFETVHIRLSSQTSGNGTIEVEIPCESLDEQLSSLVHACTSSLPSLDTVKDVYIFGDIFDENYWQDITMNRLWLEFWQPFASVENLYISKNTVLRIVPALQQLVRGRATDVLPNLQNLFLEGLRSSGFEAGLIQNSIKPFIASRQLSGNPITASVWNGNWV